MGAWVRVCLKWGDQYVDNSAGGLAAFAEVAEAEEPLDDRGLYEWSAEIWDADNAARLAHASDRGLTHAEAKETAVRWINEQLAKYKR